MQYIWIKYTKVFTKAAIALVFAIILMTFFTVKNPAYGAFGINRQINFQGKLVNNPAATNVSNTSYSVVFTIYDKDTGGTALWTETQSVTTTDGIFRVSLGSVTPFPANFNFNWTGLYLGMKVGADLEMTPRIQLAAVPFAFNAMQVAGLTVQDDTGNASTSGTLRVGNGKTLTFSGSNGLTFNDPGGAVTVTFPAAGSITLVDTGTSQTLTNKIIGSTGLTFTGASTDITTGTNEDFVLSPNGTGKIGFNTSGTLLSSIDLRGNPVTGGTLSIASVSGNTSFAALVIDNSGLGDLFTASAAGAARFTITRSGFMDSVGASSISGSLTFKSGASSIQSTAFNSLTLGGSTTGQVVLSGFNGSVNGVSMLGYNTCTLKTTATGVITCGTDLQGSGISPITENSALGYIFQNNSTEDFLFGGNSTASSKFAFTGFAGNQTQASFSGQFILMPNSGFGGNASIAGQLTVGALGATGAYLQSVNNQLLTIGGNSTGNIQFKPGNSANSLYLSSNGDAWIGSLGGVGDLGINTGGSQLAGIDVREFTNGEAAASFSARTVFVSLIANNDGAGDLFTASASGWTRFRIDNNGNIYQNGNLNFGGTNTIAQLQTLTNQHLSLNAGGFGLVGINTDGVAPLANFDIRANLGTLAIASVSGATSYAALTVDNSGTGALITASSAGATRFVINQNGSVGVGGSLANTGFTFDVLGSARIGSSSNIGDDIFKSTSSDFTQSGYSVGSTVDGASQVATVNNQLQLVTDLISASGFTGLTAPVNGPAIGANVSTGAIAFQRPDSKFILIPANGQKVTKMYDHTIGGNTGTFLPGPDLPLNTGAGTIAFQRPDSKFLVVIGGTDQSAIYTATGSAYLNGSFALGPRLTAAAGAGSLALRRSDGKFIVVLGNGSNISNVYDPAVGPVNVANPIAATDSGSFTAGPLLTGNVTTGSFAFETVFGKWIVGLGGSSTTNVYDPTTQTFSAGPSLAGGATTGAGAHVIQRPDYTYLLILGGNSANTQVYNPYTNSFTNVSTPTLSAGAQAGAHSFQMSNGSWITILGGGAAATTNIYDPVNGGTYGAYSSGTSLDPDLFTGNNAGAGALTFQRPDGKYIVVTGGGAATTTLYDAGWNTTGTWTSENITNTKISTYSAIMWSGDPQSANNNARLDKSTTSIAVKTAVNAGSLSSANWNSITDSGNLIGGTVNPAGAIQMQVTFNAPIRSYPQLVTSYVNQSNVWGGEGFTFNRRSFLQPTIYTLRVTNPMVQYGGIASDPAFGRNFATAGALLEGVVTDNNNQIVLATNRNLPTATNSAGFFMASSSAALGFATGVGAGGMTLELPNGNYLIIPGNLLTTTMIYNPDTNSTAPGPTTPTAAAAGAHAFQLPNGNFFIVLGGNTKNTAIYDTAANVFYSGPQLANAANTGSQTFQRPDGLYVILGGSGMFTNIYDPFLNTVTAGPNLTCSAGAGTLILRRPDARITVLCGGTATGNTYDAALNAFTAGPNMTAGTLGAGSTAFQLSSGRFLVKQSALATQLLDPVTNTFTLGPVTIGNIAAGSFVIPRPDGKVMLAQGGTTSTQIYDPDTGATNVTGTFAIPAYSPTLPCTPGAGAHVFQRSDGAYVLICGGGTNNMVVIDAGWNLGGSYFSEQIYEPTLSANSSIFWQNASNLGNIYVKYRTAATQAALGVAAWKDARVSGSLISSNNGDQWIQTRFDLQGSIPDNPGAKSKVWLSTDTGMVTYYRTVSAPVLSTWKLTNNAYPSLLTLTANGSNAFRFSADGQAYTNSGGAWNSGGADLAERYTSAQSLEAGEVVVGDKLNSQNVTRSTDAYQSNIMGVVSTQPGFVAGSYTPNSYPIALVGRVPVKISTENGSVHSGDYLTSASIPGYAMKATTAGRVLGTALEDFNEDTAVDCPKDGAGSLSTTKCGTIMAFINLTNYNGESVEMLMADKGFTAPDTTNGIKTETGLSSFMNAIAPKDYTVLSFLENLKAQGSAESKSSILTGTVNAINSVISPEIIAGIITAKTIRADKIEGLEIYTQKLDSLSNDMAVLAASTQSGEFIIASSSGVLNASSLNINGLAVVNGNVNVKGDGLFEGILTVIKSISTPNLLVSDFASFFGDVLFKKNVKFDGRPTFNSDTAGFAVIKKGETQVKISFDDEYQNMPIVTASIALDKSEDANLNANLEELVLSGKVAYVITDKTTKGFTIKLNKALDQDISFSWVSLSVNNPKVSGLDLSPTPSIAPATTSAGFQSLLNQIQSTGEAGPVK